MSPIAQQILLMILDKFLLTCAAGIVIAIITSREIERYKRNQAVILELGKAAATALVQIMSKFSACDSYLAAVTRRIEARGGPGELTEEEKAKLRELTDNLGKQIAQDAILLDSYIKKKVEDYHTILDEIAVGHDSPARFKRLLEKARTESQYFQPLFSRFLPSMPLPD